MSSIDLRKFTLSLVTLALLAGCSSLDQIYKIRNVSDNTTVSTDATQRLVINRNFEKISSGKARMVCAEPSPDVAYAVSEALKFGLSLASDRRGAEGDTRNFSGSTGFERAIATSVVQLGERLAVIQLIRDKMYRACEAFANNAITAPSYTLMLSRLDKTMVSLLASEMAAGAFGRTLTGAGGSAAVGISPEEFKTAQNEFDKASLVLKEELAKKPDERKDIEVKTKAVSDALARLLRLEASSLLAVSMNASGAGSIQGFTRSIGSGGAPTLAVVDIHRNYLDDEGIEPLMDACIVGLTTELEKDQITALTTAGAAIKSLENDIQQAFEVRSTTREAAEGDKADPQLKRDAVGAEAKYRALLNRKRHATADSYAAAGLLFQAFCVENVLDGRSDLFEARAKSKKEMREIAARMPSQARDLELKVCLAASQDKELPGRAQILAECAKVIGGGSNSKP